MADYPQPQTKAGRGLLEGIQQTSERLDVALNAMDYIVAIEQEARAALRAELAAKVAALPVPEYDTGDVLFVDREAVSREEVLGG